MLTERSQTQKPHTLMIPFLWNSKKGNITVTESRTVAGSGKVNCKGTWRKFGGDRNTLYCDCGDGYTTRYIC